MFINDSTADSFAVEVIDRNITHAIIAEDEGNLSFTTVCYINVVIKLLSGV